MGYSITFPITNKYVCSVMSLCDTWTVAHQAPLVLGIFQARILEQVAISYSSWPRDRANILQILHWHADSLPLCHLKEVKVKVTQSCPALCDLMECPWSSPDQNTGVGSLSFLSPGDFANPRIKRKFPALQADFLPAEPKRRPKNTGVVA